MLAAIVLGKGASSRGFRGLCLTALDGVDNPNTKRQLHVLFSELPLDSVIFFSPKNEAFSSSYKASFYLLHCYIAKGPPCLLGTAWVALLHPEGDCKWLGKPSVLQKLVGQSA